MVFCIMSRTLPLTGWWTGYNYPPALRCQVLGPLPLTRYEYVCDLHQNAYSFSVDSGDRPICAHPGCFTGTWWILSLPQPCYNCMIVQGLLLLTWFDFNHYDDVTMSLMASQITSLTVVYSIVYSDADQRKHQSSAYYFFIPNGYTIEVWVWMSNFIAHFMMYMITYPCWDLSLTMLIKGVPEVLSKVTL